MESGAESRRSARIAGRFWVAVEGVDAELMPRRGDISATGIFFEHDAEIGEVGTVQWLHVASWDRSRSVQLMAYVVRAVTLADVQREVRGVALAFMPESDEAAGELCDFVKHVLEHGGETIAPRVQARAAASDGEASHVDVKNLSVQTLLLETDWALAVGEPVRVEIIARGVRKPIRVEGQAVSVLPSTPRGGKRYRIAVQVKNELEGPLRRFSSPEINVVVPPVKTPEKDETKERYSGPLDALLSALIEPKAEPPERHHLTGLLSRIPFTSLCQLVELERLSGVLTIRRESGATRIFVKDGRFVDVDGHGEPRKAVAALLGSRDGAFDFDVGAVDRADRIGAGMTELLLDLARESDERVR